MKILIGADLVPTKSNMELFKSGETQTLLGTELADVLKSADYRIFNLEVPLTDTNSPIPKCGPALIAPTGCINGYQAMGVDLLTLANNHILDQNLQGLKSTINTLNHAGISYVGVGDTLEEAARPYIFECDGKRIGIYACAEHEFSIVTEDSAGANPIDLLESPDHVAALKAQCDYVIVLYHGGKEHYRYPSPNLQKVCRKLVDKGADLVVCQHSHCIGCEEMWNRGTIVYGQGNFLFDNSESEFWQTSLLIELMLEKDSEGINVKIFYHPLFKNGECVRLAKGEKAEKVLEAFKKRSETITDPNNVRSEYQKFANDMLTGYLSRFSGIGKHMLLYRIINKLSGYRFEKWMMKKKYRKQNMLAIRNSVECEAHRELILKGLEASENE